jgi:hypothetical protein
LFSNTLSLRSFLNVSDKASHPYKTTGKTQPLANVPKGTLKLKAVLHRKRQQTTTCLHTVTNQNTVGVTVTAVQA